MGLTETVSGKEGSGGVWSGAGGTRPHQTQPPTWPFLGLSLVLGSEMVYQGAEV